MEQTVIKSGEIFVQNKGILKSTWVSKYCQIHRKTPDQHAFIELFDDIKTYHDSQGKKCTKIDLQHVKSIKTSQEATNKGTEYLIEIHLKSQKHILMCKNDVDFNDWFRKLNAATDITERGSGEASSASIEQYSDDDDNDDVIVLNQMYASTDQVHRFLVTVESSALAKLCDIEGQMTLLVTSSTLAFEDPNTKRIKYTFELNWLRRFGKCKNNFNFETGRKCPNGQGNITCLSDHAKAIHKLVEKTSNSRSKTVIPHTQETRDVNENNSTPNTPVERPPDLPPQDKHGGISHVTPVTAPTLGKRHPGQKNLPNLIPIKALHPEPQAPKSPTTPPLTERRGSKGKAKTQSREMDNQAVTLQDNAHVRTTSYKAAVNPTFARELEEKLSENNIPATDTGKGTPLKKEDSVKTKEEKKREKEEKKRREKEEKKEKEREEKERKQREKEEKERKLKEKEEKKHSKIKDTEKSKPRNQSVRLGNNIYDEPDLLTPPASAGEVQDNGPLYDEAASPRKNIPAVYAQPLKRKEEDMVDDTYDDGRSVAEARKSLNKVEYAQPYVKKGGVPINQDSVTYAEVNSVQQEAWKKFGIEEKFHEENYSKIKSACAEMTKAPPPVPVKAYDDDEDDGTYDNIPHNKNQRPKSDNMNTYGTASAKEIGDLSGIVLDPEGGYASDSGEENMYDDPQYDDYTVAGDVQKDQPSVSKVSDTYEEATPKLLPKSAPPKKPVPKEVLYEEVP